MSITQGRVHPFCAGQSADPCPGALYRTFAPAEARRILRRLQFHYTPKHASWLNMVEIEISLLQGQCLGRRIDDLKHLGNEIAARERRQNKAHAHINWMFTTDSRQTGARLSRHAKESKSLLQATRCVLRS